MNVGGHRCGKVYVLVLVLVLVSIVSVAIGGEKSEPVGVRDGDEEAPRQVVVEVSEERWRVVSLLISEEDRRRISAANVVTGDRVKVAVPSDVLGRVVASLNVMLQTIGDPDGRRAVEEFVQALDRGALAIGVRTEMLPEARAVREEWLKTITERAKRDIEIRGRIVDIKQAPVDGVRLTVIRREIDPKKVRVVDQVVERRDVGSEWVVELKKVYGATLIFEKAGQLRQTIHVFADDAPAVLGNIMVVMYPHDYVEPGTRDVVQVKLWPSRGLAKVLKLPGGDIQGVEVVDGVHVPRGFDEEKGIIGIEAVSRQPDGRVELMGLVGGREIPKFITLCVSGDEGDGVNVVGYVDQRSLGEAIEEAKEVKLQLSQRVRLDGESLLRRPIVWVRSRGHAWKIVVVFVSVDVESANVVVQLHPVPVRD